MEVENEAPFQKFQEKIMSLVKELKSPLPKKNGFHSKSSSGNNCFYPLIFMIRRKNIINKKAFEWNWK